MREILAFTTLRDDASDDQHCYRDRHAWVLDEPSVYTSQEPLPVQCQNLQRRQSRNAHQLNSGMPENHIGDAERTSLDTRPTTVVQSTA